MVNSSTQPFFSPQNVSALKFMLIGQYTSKLTDKDRISVPSKFREHLGEYIVAARWYENCVVIVSKENWKNLRSRLVGPKKIITSPVRDIDRFILGSAFDLSLDKQGRFVIPEVLKRHADIKSEVVFLGLGERVEVWSIDNWNALESDVQEKASQAVERIAKTSE